MNIFRDIVRFYIPLGWGGYVGFINIVGFHHLSHTKDKINNKTVKFVLDENPVLFFIPAVGWSLMKGAFYAQFAFATLPYTIFAPLTMSDKAKKNHFERFSTPLGLPLYAKEHIKTDDGISKYWVKYFA